ncbi:hypothetical protein [Mixta sp. Marseille-Q2659]|uniref:hypothetical protein n=1 Tax=Mixta sp. Marseille-Q2659 TaxID=2736607 RepID=UPI0023BA3B44|nr:hypothetical protein [Mixta sp. Marseille-Q2659]
MKLTPLTCFIRRLVTLAGTLSLTLAFFSPAACAADILEAITVKKGSTLTLNDGDTITVTGGENNLCAICNSINDSDSTPALGKT